MPTRLGAPRQRSFDDISLQEVTFCAVDLETTGVSAKTCQIVEIGAVRSKGGEPSGTFSCLVRPPDELPVEIQLLTGIAPSMLETAAELPSVLPSFIEFLGTSVLVAHNARFDVSFLQAACRALDYEMPEVPTIDTAKLARRLVSGNVRNCRLATLASHFRTTHKPSHRAFPDAAACLEILYALIERAAAYGVATLQELIELQQPRSGPHFEKIRMAKNLPRTKGVYMFLNARSEVIYVGKATNLRTRVRSYFVSDERKRSGELRAEIASVRILECATDVESEATEARLIETLGPRYNRVGKPKRAPVYLKLTEERHPRLSVVKSPVGKGVHIGPFSSRASAQAAASTFAGLFGIRTCALKLGTAEPCSLYSLGACHGPCTGRTDAIAAHDNAVSDVRDDLAGGLRVSSTRITQKLTKLAKQHRFEEAAVHRDAFETFARTVDRARNCHAIAGAGLLEVTTERGKVTLQNGFLKSRPGAAPGTSDFALPVEGLNERAVIASWLARCGPVAIESTESPLVMPWPRPKVPAQLDL